jgi:SAM-dependent methyltransferase
MTKNKYHWYDGWFYDVVIAPNQDKLFEQVKNLIEPGSRVIDIGCGTGRLEFAIAGKCQFVLGIDLSEKNIDRDNLRLIQNPNDKISFLHNNVQELTGKGQLHFDYAILTYVIHEVDEEERITLLNEIALIADKIIIGDYLVPRPKGFSGFLSEVIEFIAGSEHYRNYKSYMANGGNYHLANMAGLKIINETSNNPLSNHIVVLSK